MHKLQLDGQSTRGLFEQQAKMDVAVSRASLSDLELAKLVVQKLSLEDMKELTEEMAGHAAKITGFPLGLDDAAEQIAEAAVLMEGELRTAGKDTK